MRKIKKDGKITSRNIKLQKNSKESSNAEIARNIVNKNLSFQQPEKLKKILKNAKRRYFRAVSKQSLNEPFTKEQDLLSGGMSIRPNAFKLSI